MAVSMPLLSLDTYEISENTGFLPEKPPLSSLPAYFNKWEELASQLTKLIQDKQLRDAVHQLPVLEFSDKTLHSVEEWRRALVVLTFIFQGYMWQEGESGLPSKMPSILSIPFNIVSQKIGVPLVGVYAASVLYNWRVESDKPLSVKNLHALFTFTGTEDESWFYMLTVQVELDAVPAINAIYEGVNAMQEGNTTKLISNLKIINSTLKVMQCTLERMTDNCNPQVFFVKIRPFFAGTKGLDTFPNGMIYEGVDSEPRQYYGSSAGQSSAVKAIDHFIGVQHFGKDEEFLDAMQYYMPRKHREFLQSIRLQKPSLRQYVIDSHNEELIKEFNSTVETFVKYRTYHLIMVTRYMVNQRKHSVNASLDTKGTGGTSFMTFLKNVRDNTKAMLI